MGLPTPVAEQTVFGFRRQMPRCGLVRLPHGPASTEYIRTMPHDTRSDLQVGAAPMPNLGGGARLYVMPNTRRPVPGCASPTGPVADGDHRNGGMVLQFPVRKRGRFDAKTRAHLGRLAARIPAIQPLLFGYDEQGAEWCRFGNGLVMSWEKPDRMILTDTFSGYVDRGPFDSLDEICLLVMGLDA